MTFDQQSWTRWSARILFNVGSAICIWFLTGFILDTAIYALIPLLRPVERGAITIIVKVIIQTTWILSAVVNSIVNQAVDTRLDECGPDQLKMLKSIIDERLGREK